MSTMLSRVQLDKAEVSDKNKVPEEISIDFENVPTTDGLYNEINSIIKDANSIIFPNNLNFTEPEGIKDLNFDGNYIEESVSYMKELSLEIGSNQVPRFNCACHKLNLAIRLATRNHQELSDLLKSITQSSVNIRKVIRLSNTFRLLKFRLRLENLTRWSSSYLMLESVKRAHSRNAFQGLDFEIPMTLIDIYLQILKPAYILTLSWQKETVTIADLLLGITKYIHDLERYDLEEKPKRFCLILIKCIKDKFHYELNQSAIHRAAQMMKISSAFKWINKDFSKSMVDVGLNSLKSACCAIVYRDKVEEVDSSMRSDGSYDIYSGIPDAVYSEGTSEARLFKFEKDLDKEISFFSEFFTSKEKLRPITDTKKFWLKNRSKMPILFNLAIITLSIPASSAYIERFFSVSGVICANTRSFNMKDDLIIMRSMLKANYKILFELASTYSDKQADE